MKTFLNPELFSDCLLFPLFMTDVKEYTRPVEVVQHNCVFCFGLDCVSESTVRLKKHNNKTREGDI